MRGLSAPAFLKDHANGKREGGGGGIELSFRKQKAHFSEFRRSLGLGRPKIEIGKIGGKYTK